MNEFKRMEAENEKNMILKDNKIAHLEKLKEDSKKESSETINSLKQTVATLQKEKNDQKSNTDATYNEKLTKLYKDHQSEMQIKTENMTK